MKKYILLLLILLSSFGFSQTLRANELPTTLVVHYYRYDDNYTNFNFWLWAHEPVAGGGIQHSFDVSQKDEHGVYLEVDLTQDYTNATTIGIIIKQGGWDGYREVGGDRFIDLENAEKIGNTVHAYFVEQDLNIGTSQADLTNNIPDYRARILTSAFDIQYRIQAELTHIPTHGYDVLEDGEVLFSNTASSKSLTISVPNINIAKSYVLRVHFDESRSDEKQVSLQNIYDTVEFENLYSYDGTLGVSFEDDYTVFRLWAPLAQSVDLNLYNQGHPNYNNQGQASDELTPYVVHALYAVENGAWEVKLPGSLMGKYYTFTVDNTGVPHEVTDPYAYSTGANGLRGMVVDFQSLNPTDWSYNSRPNNVVNNTDYIVYELHVRDLTSHTSWIGNESYRGKFLGMSQTGTTYTHSNGVTVTTGLDHIIELGVNAVQLLPIFDFGYVDEVQVALNPNYQNVFNWGYMPYHFNTLEGSYSTNPFDGGVRINEFKRTVQAFHDHDIRVIMDVVYNHTGESETSNFHKIVPGYYHRLTSTGGFSNGSGTGNETASERAMARKFMLDSLEFWATEYNLSGFRFDLMELHDVETMNQIQDMLYEIDPTIIVYGEPWMGGTSPLPNSMRAGKDNLADMPYVGAFNDITRDAVKGSVFQANDRGWVQGNVNTYNYQGIQYGIVGGIDHPVITQFSEWHLDPNQTINYVEAHDNNTLFDKLRLTGITTNAAKPLLIQSNAIILTSQGVPFLHAGVEFMRSKPLPGGGYDHNSYESPDSVNQMRWDRKAIYMDVFEYYKDLIQIRLTYSHFRINNAPEILERLTFLETSAGEQAIAYEIKGVGVEPDVIVIHSGNPSVGLSIVDLDPSKSYKILTTFEHSNVNGIDIISGTAYVLANSSMILVEVTDELAVVNSDTVVISTGQAFNPLDNLTLAFDQNDDVAVYVSNYHDINRPGYYVITVAIVEPHRVHHYHYTLHVTGNRFNITVNYQGGS